MLYIVSLCIFFVFSSSFGFISLNLFQFIPIRFVSILQVRINAINTKSNRIIFQKFVYDLTVNYSVQFFGISLSNDSEVPTCLSKNSESKWLLHSSLADITSSSKTFFWNVADILAISSVCSVTYKSFFSRKIICQYQINTSSRFHQVITITVVLVLIFFVNCHF